MEDKNAEMQSMQELLIQAEQRTDSMNGKLKKLTDENAALRMEVKLAKSADETMKVQHTNALKTTLNTIVRKQAEKGRSKTLMRIAEAKKG